MAQFLYSNFLFCLQQKPETLFQQRSYSSSQMHKISPYIQKQWPRGVLQKRCSQKFYKINGKTPDQSLYLNKVAGLTLLKQRRWHEYFPVTFAKFPRTPFLTEHLQWPFLCMMILLLVTLLLILKMCLSVDINFWKTPLRITFKNLKKF